MKPISLKRVRKTERERKVLMGLVELYIKTGRPVGSNTLRDVGFGDLSSATIRNYFVYLEQEGCLRQQHTSGGRIPTSKAYRLYADEVRDKSTCDPHTAVALRSLNKETKEVTAYLNQAAEQLSQVTGCAVFLSAPRFDHDFVLDIKLLALDSHRCLCVLVTDFGSILTEVLHSDCKLTAFSVHRMESYLTWRLTGLDEPKNLNEEERELAQQFYNESMVRFITRYSSFRFDDVYRAGFSRLLNHPEFGTPAALAAGLSLFEDQGAIHDMLADCRRSGDLTYWIGEDLGVYSPNLSYGSVIMMPYSIHRSHVGAVGLFGPQRLPYPEIFGALRYFSEVISTTLSQSLYKFQIQYRQPEREPIRELRGHSKGALLVNQGAMRLLESQSNDLDMPTDKEG